MKGDVIMKQIKKILFAFLCFFFATNINVVHAEEASEDTDDLQVVLDTIAENDLTNGESISVLDGKYTITCQEILEESPSLSRNVFSTTKTYTKTYLVSSSGDKAFSLQQTVVAVFNTYTEKVCINSHNVTFTSYDSSYYLDHTEQVSSLNSWNSSVVASQKNVYIGKIGSGTMLICANASVTYSGTFRLSFN